MKNKLIRVLATVMFFMTTVGISAQNDSIKKNKLNVGVAFLSHGEIMRGGLPEDGDAEIEEKSQFLLGRLRLVLGYERKGLEARAVIQNSNVWGAEGDEKLNLYEGWVKMTAKSGLFLQFGRIALTYDDERIIGPNDFAMAANSHDVFRLGYEGHGHQLHAIVTYNQNPSHIYKDTYYDEGSQYYKTMQTVWYHYDVPKIPLGASLLFMNIGLQAGVKGDAENPPHTKFQQVYGGYLNYHPKNYTLEASYYRQAGKQVTDDRSSVPISAWMAGVKGTVNLSDKYGFALGYDYLSGDDYVPVIYGGEIGLVRHAKLKGFSPVYGSRTKFYGIMDYFYESAYRNGFTPGLQNAFVNVFAQPIDKLNCSATYHYLAVATHLRGMNDSLGHSIELQGDYHFTKDVSLSVGYTLMFGTQTMESIKQSNGTKAARWGWFSLNISPSIFTARW